MAAKKQKTPSEKATPLCPDKKGVVKKAKDLSNEDFQRLVARRARALLNKRVDPFTNKKTRKEAEREISQFFEKINLGADFLPAIYLVNGATRAKAVCRISTPRSLGTGFLIADGNYIMTNNHVLNSIDQAARSTAEFGFEEGSEDVTRIALLPDLLFITDRNLDFTIVACDSTTLVDVEPIALLRNPATVSRNEQVNIIQHPSGRKKEIAIHNNRVKRIQDLVIHYETDTEPGSSGSPVFNNAWELVALHHAGWSEGGGQATNEGVRMSAIVAHLLRLEHTEARQREGLENILRTIPDSSPYLGFFDVVGVGRYDKYEVEVPDFTGNPDFADIGFWNIEHFNDTVTNTRVQDVADVFSRLSMDVMGLVEVQQGALDRLVTEMQSRGDAVDYQYLNVSGRQDLAVLYDVDTSTVELVEDIPNRHAELLNARSPSGKTVFPRHPLFAKCSVTEGNSTPVEFIMIVVHLKAFGDAQSRARRRLAAQALATIIQDIHETEQIPVVLGGDFNERLDTDVLSALTGSPDLFSMTADDASNNAISYVGQRHRSLIDHIIVSRDVQAGDIAGDDAAIVRLDRSVSDFASDVSDHVPIVFRMIYRNRPIVIEEPEPEPHRISIPEGSSTVAVGFE